MLVTTEMSLLASTVHAWAEGRAMIVTGAVAWCSLGELVHGDGCTVEQETRSLDRAVVSGLARCWELVWSHGFICRCWDRWPCRSRHWRLDMPHARWDGKGGRPSRSLVRVREVEEN